MEQKATLGPARGREVRRIFSELVSKVNVATVDQVRDTFNARFQPPIDSRAVGLLAKAVVKEGRLRRVRRGIFTGKEGPGPILPLLEAINPAALVIWRTLEGEYPSPTDTRDLQRLAKLRTGTALRATAIYPALRLLSEQGLVRWQHGIVTAARIHLARSPLLGGVPTDIGVDRSELPPLQDVDVEPPKGTRQHRETMTDDEIERHGLAPFSPHEDDPLGLYD